MMDAALDDKLSYGSGGYLYLLEHDPTGWRRRVEFLRGLPGLRHVELWCEVLSLPVDEVTELVEMLSGLSVLVHAPHLQLSMVSHHDLVRGATAEIYRQTMLLADQLSAKVVTFHCGARPFFMDEGLALEQIAAVVSALRETGARAEPTIKNMPIEGRRLVLYPASLMDLERCMERVPDLKVTLDIGHCVQNEDDWIKFLRRFALRIANIHLHDAQPQGASGLRLGTGALDVFALARLLRAVGYAGHVSLATTGQKDTVASWEVWRRAQTEAAEETTATLSASALRE